MKIVCQSCGKRYDTDQDELCPRCGSYNAFSQEKDRSQSIDSQPPKYRAPRTMEKASRSNRESFGEVRSTFSREDSESASAPAKKKQRGVAAYIGIFVIIMLVVNVGSQALFWALERLVDQSLDQMTVETSPVGEGFTAGDAAYIVKGSMEVALDGKKYDELSAYTPIAPGMQLTMVVLDQQTEGAFFEYGELACYLKQDGCVYYPVDNWELNQLVEQETGIELPYLGREVLPGEKGILFMTPPQEDVSRTFCVQDIHEMEFVGIDKVDCLIQVDITGEEIA